MRDFTCKDKDTLVFDAHQSVVDEPCFDSPSYGVCLTEELLDGSIMYHDMTSVIQDVDNFVERVGPSVVQSLLLQLQPQPLQQMDQMTDEQKFDCVVSRYCQTVSERTALLEYLSANHADLLAQVTTGESESTPALDNGADAAGSAGDE